MSTMSLWKFRITVALCYIYFETLSTLCLFLWYNTIVTKYSYAGLNLLDLCFQLRDVLLRIIDWRSDLCASVQYIGLFSKTRELIEANAAGTSGSLVASSAHKTMDPIAKHRCTQYSSFRVLHRTIRCCWCISNSTNISFPALYCTCLYVCYTSSYIHTCYWVMWFELTAKSDLHQEDTCTTGLYSSYYYTNSIRF